MFKGIFSLQLQGNLAIKRTIWCQARMRSTDHERVFRPGGSNEITVFFAVLQRTGCSISPAQCAKWSKARSGSQEQIFILKLYQHSAGLYLSQPEYQLIKGALVAVRNAEQSSVKAGSTGQRSEQHVDVPGRAKTVLQHLLRIVVAFEMVCFLLFFIAIALIGKIPDLLGPCIQFAQLLFR